MLMYKPSDWKLNQDKLKYNINEKDIFKFEENQTYALGRSEASVSRVMAAWTMAMGVAT